MSLSRADVVVLDHLQKVDVQPVGDELRTYAIRRVMDRLHAIGLRDRKVIWVNVQLSRETEHRHGPPMLSDIRDSGSIEEAARQVYLLYWPWKHAPAKRAPTEYEGFVAKNNEGGTGKVTLHFEARVGRFTVPDGAPESGEVPF